MIRHPSFVVDPWALRETTLDLEVLAQTESVFALANGHIGLRGNLEEGEPHGLPGTYLNGFHERRPLRYVETAFGYPESEQTIVNVTNGKIVRLLVDDEPFDVRYGGLRDHQRVLDLRAGVLRRDVRWISPAGRAVRISTVRLVSFAHRSVAALCYEVEPLDAAAEVVIQSELVANETLPAVVQDDPRSSVGAGTLVAEQHANRDEQVVLVHATPVSGLRVGAGMDHLVDGPPGVGLQAQSSDDLGRVTITATIAPGRGLRLVKLLAYGWSGKRSLPAMRDQVEAALVMARRIGWEGLLSAQREYLDAFWDRADVEIGGDAELQQALRFALFHTLQAGARTEQRPIAAKGLTGPGYDGHTFWDAEAFVLPVLTYTVPEVSADPLRWRHATLGHARARATTLGLAGAAFPWRTIDGQECSGYWPASIAAFHVNANIADAAIRYHDVTADDDFERDISLALLVETARLWISLGHHDSQGRFRIDGVTGPDEYSALADNNTYTNLMAQRNLLAAAEAFERHPAHTRALGVDAEEAARWRDAAHAVLVPFDEALGVHPQAEGFTEHERWDFSATSADEYPLMLHFPYFNLYRKQVVKQADLVLALYRRGDAFTDDEKQRDFDYYEQLTVRDSSLSACVQAIIAAEVGHLDLAYAYVGEAALVDLCDIDHNTRDGLHIASLAGAWLATVAGFGGLRDHDGRLSFNPRLPPRLDRLAFRLTYHGQRLRVAVDQHTARYTVLDGNPLELDHARQPIEVRVGQPVTRPLEHVSERIPPTHPPGRAPSPRQPPA